MHDIRAMHSKHLTGKDLPKAVLSAVRQAAVVRCACGSRWNHVYHCLLPAAIFVDLACAFSPASVLAKEEVCFLLFFLSAYAVFR